MDEEIYSRMRRMDKEVYSIMRRMDEDGWKSIYLNEENE